MGRSFRVLFSLLAFVLFSTSIGTRGFTLKELSHDLDHHGQANIVSINQLQKHTQKTSESLKSEPLGEVEHQLLHAIMALHLLASSSAGFTWGAFTHALKAASSSFTLPLAKLESPFKPPRGLAAS